MCYSQYKQAARKASLPPVEALEDLQSVTCHPDETLESFHRWFATNGVKISMEVQQRDVPLDTVKQAQTGESCAMRTYQRKVIILSLCSVFRCWKS